MQSYDGDQGSLFPTYQIEGIPLLEPIKHDEFEYQVVTKVLRQAMLKVKPATYIADFPKLTRRSGALLTDPGEKETELKGLIPFGHEWKMIEGNSHEVSMKHAPLKGQCR